MIYLQIFLNCFKILFHDGFCVTLLFFDYGRNFVGAIINWNNFFRFSTIQINTRNSYSTLQKFISNGNLFHHVTHILGVSGKPPLAAPSLIWWVNKNKIYTVIAQIKSPLNSRPLTSLSEAQQDLEVLKVRHFLIRYSLKFLPQEDFINI